MSANLVALTPADLPELLDLCSAALPLDTFSLRLLESRVFEDPRFQPGLALGFRSGRRLVGAMVGVLRTVADGDLHGWIKLLVVDAGHRRGGVGTALLHEMEERFQAAGVMQIDTVGAPYYFWPGVDVRYTPACCFFERMGYTEHRYTLSMAVDLGSQDFDIRPQERKLAEQGLTLHRADSRRLNDILDFIRQEWPPWADEVQLAMRNDPVSMFYAAREGQVVAFAAYDTAMFRGTFGPMGTDASLRGLGVGGVLLKRCLREMKELGYERCEIAWVGPVGFYARQVGATICRIFRDYRRTLAPAT